jgi:hypothetical protein
VILPGRAHYLAPAACLAVALTVEGMRHLRLWRRRDGGAGRVLVAALPLVALLLLPLRALAQREDPREWHLRRAALERRLAALPEGQLVLVRYGPGHDARAEWVYDGADLVGTRVLWARAMDAAADCALVTQEGHRTAWLLEVDDDVSDPRLLRYPREACAGVVAPPGAASSSRPPP